MHASLHARGSRYGGALENRTRFFRNIVAKIRDRVPGLIVTSRMNAYDAMAYPYGFGVDRDDATRPDLGEPHRAGRGSCATTARRWSTSPSAILTSTRTSTGPFDLPVAGAPMPPEHPLEGVARFVHIVRGDPAGVPGLCRWSAAAIRGCGSSSRTWRRRMVREGWASLVGGGRDGVRLSRFRARHRSERAAWIRSRCCVACSACTQIMRDGGRTGCVPRDAAIYEPIYKAGRAEALDTIQAMAKTCRQCNDPTCVPGARRTSTSRSSWRQIAEGRFREAYETIRAANVLAAVCGYVCPSETLCESGCINEHYSEPVPIRHLQRWVSRKAVEEGWAAEPRPVLRRRRASAWRWSGAGSGGRRRRGHTGLNWGTR